MHAGVFKSVALDNVVVERLTVADTERYPVSGTILLYNVHTASVFNLTGTGNVVSSVGGVLEAQYVGRVTIKDSRFKDNWVEQLTEGSRVGSGAAIHIAGGVVGDGQVG